MKKLFIILFLFLGFNASSQYVNRDSYSVWTGRMGVGITYTTSLNAPPASYVLLLGDSAATKALGLPRVQTTAAITTPRQGMFVYSISDSSLYFRRLYSWVKVDGSGGGSGERFGVSGEDARATQERYFSLRGVNSFVIDSISSNQTYGYNGGVLTFEQYESNIASVGFERIIRSASSNYSDFIQKPAEFYVLNSFTQGSDQDFLVGADGTAIDFKSQIFGHGVVGELLFLQQYKHSDSTASTTLFTGRGQYGSKQAFFSRLLQDSTGISLKNKVLSYHTYHGLTVNLRGQVFIDSMAFASDTVGLFAVGINASDGQLKKINWPSGGGGVTPAALTKTDDTNVTLTLGGTPATALLQATSITVGWTGTLGVARGGTNISSYTKGDILVATGATTLVKLAVGTDGHVLTADAAETSGVKWATGGGGSGTVTSFTFTDGSGFDGTVTNSTTTPTLALTTTISSGRVVYTGASGSITGSAGLTYDGADLLSSGSGGGNFGLAARNTDATGRGTLKLGNDVNALAAFIFINGTSKTDYGGAGSFNFLTLENSAAISFHTKNVDLSRMYISPDGRIGVGTESPLSMLDLPAGTATANTAPLKLRSGTALTTEEDGVFEYHSSHLYFTIGSTRYQLDQQSGSVSDGDKGDITVSSSGTVWTIDAGVVTYAKMQDISVTQRLLGRNSSGSGDAEEVTLSELLDWSSGSQGSIMTRGALVWSSLAPGTAGKFLMSNGAAADITWETVTTDKQGSDVASATNITLTSTQGNSFELTGATDVDRISSTGWQNGSVVRLLFSGSLKIRDNIGTSGANVNIRLAGAADFVASADDILVLELSEIGGTVAWREVSRSVN